MANGETSRGEHEDIIDKRKLSYQVSKYIQEMIINSELKSGDRIVETKIAKQLGISQTPVREALRELETMGFVEIRPYWGCVVRPITKRELSQAYNLRLLLESFAMTEAAKAGNIGEDEINQLISKKKQMEQASSINDKDAFSAYDVEFHEIIIKAAHNLLLEKIWRMASVSQWTALTIETTNKPMEFFVNMHNPIIESLSIGDFDLARKEIENHFTTCLKLVEAGFLNVRNGEEE